MEQLVSRRLLLLANLEFELWGLGWYLLFRASRRALSAPPTKSPSVFILLPSRALNFQLKPSSASAQISQVVVEYFAFLFLVGVLQRSASRRVSAQPRRDPSIGYRSAADADQSRKKRRCCNCCRSRVIELKRVLSSMGVPYDTTYFYLLILAICVE